MPSTACTRCPPSASRRRAGRRRRRRADTPARATAAARRITGRRWWWWRRRTVVVVWPRSWSSWAPPWSWSGAAVGGRRGWPSSVGVVVLGAVVVRRGVGGAAASTSVSVVDHFGHLRGDVGDLGGQLGEGQVVALLEVLEALLEVVEPGLALLGELQLLAVAVDELEGGGQRLALGAVVVDGDGDVLRGGVTDVAGNEHDLDGDGHRPAVGARGVGHGRVGGVDVARDLLHREGQLEDGLAVLGVLGDGGVVLGLGQGGRGRGARRVSQDGRRAGGGKGSASRPSRVPRSLYAAIAGASAQAVDGVGVGEPEGVVRAPASRRAGTRRRRRRRVACGLPSVSTFMPSLSVQKTSLPA